MNRNHNPLAPVWLAGITCPGEVYAEFPLKVALTANQTSLGNVIRIDGDACFEWRFLGINEDQTGLGLSVAYIRLRDHRGRNMSPSALRISSFAGGGQDSLPILPVYVIPAGAEILVDLYEQGGDTISVSVALRGVKRRSA